MAKLVKEGHNYVVTQQGDLVISIVKESDNRPAYTMTVPFHTFCTELHDAVESQIHNK
jgi:hypothetical protein